MRRALPLLAVLAMFTGCEQPSTEKLLGIRYEPLGGMRLREHRTVEESRPGGPVVGTTQVVYSRGLEFISVPGLTMPVESQPEAVLTAAGQPVPGTRISVQRGDHQVGKVLRAEYKDGSTRTLIYYAPLEGRGLLVRMSFPDKDYGKQVQQLEPTIARMTVVR